jgi:5-oxoprolinase (ATP-hydrolysing)
VNRFSGILSAYGLSLADVVVEKQEPCNLDLNRENMRGYIENRVKVLREECVKHLIKKENFDQDSIETEVYLNLRYYGTDTGIMCSLEGIKAEIEQLDHTDFEAVFVNK